MSLLVDGDHTGGQYDWAQSHRELDEALKTNRQAQYYQAISRVPKRTDGSREPHDPGY